MAQMVKNLPVMQETWVSPWVGKIPWRRAWQPTPLFLPGESPWTEGPGGLQSMGSQRVGHDWSDWACMYACHIDTIHACTLRVGHNWASKHACTCSIRVTCIYACCARLFSTLWAAVLQAPLSMGFSRQEYWSGLPCPPPEDLPNPGIEPVSLTSPALAGKFFTISATWDTMKYILLSPNL